MYSKKNYSSERVSEEYLEINSCGIEYLSGCDRGSNRPLGRRDYHIIYVEKGVCHLLLDGEWNQVREGGVILFRPNEPQKYFYRGEDDSVSHYVHFTGVGCESLLRRLGIYDVRVFDMGRSRGYEELSERMAVEFAMRNSFYMDWCSAQLYSMLNIIARKYFLRQSNVNRIGEKRINSACKRIYGDIKNPPAAVDLAAESCLSISRFLHLFKEATGKSYTDFVAGLRIERAKDMLVRTDMTVRDISEEVGYSDQNYFSRCFRKIEGCSPLEYKKRGGDAF